jgi:hypothetical protein
MDSTVQVTMLVVVGLWMPRVLYLYASYLAVDADAKRRRLIALRALAVGAQIGTIAGVLTAVVPGIPSGSVGGVAGFLASVLLFSRQGGRFRDFFPDWIGSYVLVMILAATITRAGLGT